MTTQHWRQGDTYLQVRPGIGHWALEVVHSTRRRPKVVRPDCVVVKLSLRMPNAAFQPLRPSAVVTVPEDLVQHPVQVEAVDTT